mmetsp:Transcript_42450/g.132018  ORF Transcript_42450/g.132018 Transcript_42450/m.132018 type:complete len:410 (+) Transcript_42450:53-1282(+)
MMALPPGPPGARRAAAPPRPPLLVRIDGEWYDLSAFAHPGGAEVLRRNSGGDATHLFYSNHWDPQLSLLRRFRLPEGCVPPPFDAGASPTSDPHSALYRNLKAEVHAHLRARGVEWRHTFRWQPYLLRLMCLIGAREALARGHPVLGLGCAAVYGLLTGRMTWTHAHNGVHNPHAIPPLMRGLMRFDFACLVEAWMGEHHTHHAHTNGERDPDAGWFRPLLDYRAVAAGGGSTLTAALACAAYPFLLPFMLARSLMHAYAADPDGRSVLLWAVPVVPLRFGIDAAVLGPAGFLAAMAVATAYIVGTFSATHQTGWNYERSGDWAIDQMHSTNDVWPRSALWSALTGGISLHTEHHLFPRISSDALPEVALVVERFARRHGLPRHAYSPAGLLARHAAFLSGAAREKRAP